MESKSDIGGMSRRSKNYRERDSERFHKSNSQHNKDWRKNNPEKAKADNRKYSFKYTYGITVEEYDKMLEEQGDKCKICGTPQSGIKKKLAVDHCHTTNKVRGILCSKCNTAIGLLNDDIELIEKVIQYLKNSK